MELGLKNATVCISGGTKGTGYESALLFAREGARVWVTAREEGGLNQTIQDLKAAGSPDALGISVELRDPKPINAAYLQIGELCGQLNTLVNMARATGAPKHQHFAEFSDNDWYHSFDVGTLAAMRCAREVCPGCGKPIGRASSTCLRCRRA